MVRTPPAQAHCTHFQPPGPAIGAHLSFVSMRSMIVDHDGLMSLVVRHELEKVACDGFGTSRKGSVEMYIGRPVALAASAKATKRALPRPYSPQLSYLKVEEDERVKWAQREQVQRR